MRETDEDETHDATAAKWRMECPHVVTQIDARKLAAHAALLADVVDHTIGEISRAAQ